MFLGIFFCCYGAVVKGITGKYHFHKPFAKHFCLLYLLVRRYKRHKNNTFYIQFFTTVRKPLGVVSGTCANNTFLQLFRRQGTHHVVGTPDFIGAHRLQIFALEVNIALVFTAQAAVKRQWRSVYYLFKPFCRRCKI